MDNASFAVMAAFVSLWLAAVVGWVWNIFKLVGLVGEPVGAEFVLRIVGIVLAPLGAIMGYV
jgi:hypothetical protein